MTKSSLALIGWLVGTASYSLAQPNVVGIELQYRLRQDGTAHYNQLWQRLANQGLEFNLTILSLKRALRDFSPDQGDCLFPTSLRSLTTTFPELASAPLFESDTVDYGALRIMTRHGEAPITSLAELDGKAIALWNGLDPSIFLQGVNARIHPTTDEDVRLNMLYAGRVDAILGFLPDTLIAADQLNFPIPTYKHSYDYFHDNLINMVCTDTPENRKFVEEFNAKLATLRSTGELRDILGPFANLDGSDIDG